MNITNITEYDNDTDIIIQALKLSIPSGILFICLISLMIYTLVKIYIHTNIYICISVSI